VVFALVYVIDPHPLAPDPSPYAGEVWEFEYSKFRQARSFAERLHFANNVSTDGVYDEVLADDLASPTDRLLDGGKSNELWCSWGPAPNAAWLIASNGTVVLAQSWFNADELNATLQRL